LAIFETFSKRQKRLERAGQQDVYQYDELPQTFKVQVVHIWNSSIGNYHRSSGYYSTKLSPANELWELTHSTLCRELGVFSLGDMGARPDSQCVQFLLGSETDGALDIIEFSFKVIDRFARRFQPYQMQEAKITQTAEDAIEELNQRFREHGIGYQ